MSIHVYIATSLDGFIARDDGSLDWLPGADGDAAAGDGEDYGYQAFIESVDVLMMGRHTFETVLGFGDWPYGELPVAVLNSGSVSIPAALTATVFALGGTPAQVLRSLQERGFEHVYVDGGQTIQRFLRAGLIDALTITRVPVLLGSGRPLFGALPADVALRHVETTAYASGLVQCRYAVVGARTDRVARAQP